jgi:hypothetical protein
MVRSRACWAKAVSLSKVMDLRSAGSIRANTPSITEIAVAAHRPAIETTGEDASADPERAADGRTPGAKGSDGAGRREPQEINGLLTLRANGGAGAKGQQGGQGAVGQTGPVGAHATARDRPGNGGREVQVAKGEWAEMAAMEETLAK